MKETTPADLAAFFAYLSRLKHLERTGWGRHGVPLPRESVAAHSFGAAFLAWIRAAEEGFDESRLIKMLLIHDLAESIMGDLTPGDMPEKEKSQAEKRGFAKLLPVLPEGIRNEAKELFEELMSGKTKEAQLAWECDKGDTILQALVYADRVPDVQRDFLRTYSSVFKTTRGKTLLNWMKSQKRVSDER